jgi:hypothetical protein
VHRIPQTRLYWQRGLITRKNRDCASNERAGLLLVGCWQPQCAGRLPKERHASLRDRHQRPVPAQSNAAKRTKREPAVILLSLSRSLTIKAQTCWSCPKIQKPSDQSIKRLKTKD